MGLSFDSWLKHIIRTQNEGKEVGDMDMKYPVVNSEGDVVLIKIEEVWFFERKVNDVHLYIGDEEYRIMRSLDDFDNWLKDFTPLDRSNLVNTKKMKRVSKTNDLVCFDAGPEGRTAKVSRRNQSKVVGISRENRSQ